MVDIFKLLPDGAAFLSPVRSRDLSTLWHAREARAGGWKSWIHKSGRAGERRYAGVVHSSWTCGATEGLRGKWGRVRCEYSPGDSSFSEWVTFESRQWRMRGALGSRGTSSSIHFSVSEWVRGERFWRTHLREVISLFIWMRAMPPHSLSLLLLLALFGDLCRGQHNTTIPCYDHTGRAQVRSRHWLVNKRRPKLLSHVPRENGGFLFLFSFFS